VLSVIWLIFAAIMIAAAVIDLISYRIPNELVLALLVLFLIVAIVNWNSISGLMWASHIGAAIGVFGAGLFLYAIRQMGAGDVKLLAVVALWSGAVGLPGLMVFVSVCGLAGMMVIVLLRMIVPRLQSKDASGTKKLPRVLTKGQGIPYAIGIGPGAIIASVSAISPWEPWLWLWPIA
jgi:prepilin peptidase CpaA